MRRLIVVALLCLTLPGAAGAACEPPSGEHRAKCVVCGNLEQNPRRGVEFAWNALLKNPEMQRQLDNQGITRLVITDMLNSSRGVLFYFALIRDPSFDIVDTDSYAEMLSLQRERDRGVRGSVDRSGPRGGAEVQWRRSVQRRLEAARSRAIRTTTRPYEIELIDQNGRGFRNNTHPVPRNNPPFSERIVGPAEIFPDDRYLERDCFDADSRFRPHAGRGGGSGAGGSGGAGPDGRGSCSVGVRFRCRDDFSNPGGSGTICSYDVTVSCA